MKAVIPLTVTKNDRVLLLAPHPDDETLAAGGLLRRAVDVGATVRVIFATDGDNNPWMQRLLEKRWRIGAADRTRYGRRRRGEALQALQRLGGGAISFEFLRYPDQGLTNLLMSDGERVVNTLLRAMLDMAPTLLILPSLLDLHPDHNALAVLARLALGRLEQRGHVPRVLSSITHGQVPSSARLTMGEVRLRRSEYLAKRDALACHASQSLFRRKWFLAKAKRMETFVVGSEALPSSKCHPVRTVATGANTLWLEVVQHRKIHAFGRSVLYMVGEGAEGACRGSKVKLQWNRRSVPVRFLPKGTAPAEARLLPRRRGGSVLLPMETVATGGSVFVKARRRWGFFDEAGWREIPSPVAGVENSPGSASANPNPSVCVVIPCYNVASACAPIVREAAGYASHVIAIDDGSSDGTGDVLRAVAAEMQGRVTVLSVSRNRGKGWVLMSCFRHALAKVDFDVLVTLDSDGQHRPQDIPALVQACREGAEFVVGERAQPEVMPWRSLVGNTIIRVLLDRAFPGCPGDTQSGFRAMDRGLVQKIVASVKGRRYETEFQILLLALAKRVRILTVPIPTVYIDSNRESHFRPLADSARILRVMFRWILSDGRVRSAWPPRRAPGVPIPPE